MSVLLLALMLKGRKSEKEQLYLSRVSRVTRRYQLGQTRPTTFSQ